MPRESAEALSISNRQLPLLESPLTRRKEMIAPRSNRQFPGCLRIPGLRFPTSNPGPPTSQLGVNPCRVFLSVSHSKQTIGARDGCQFYPYALSGLLNRRICRAEAPGATFKPYRAQACILPTRLALDYDSAPLSRTWFPGEGPAKRSSVTTKGRESAALKSRRENGGQAAALHLDLNNEPKFD